VYAIFGATGGIGSELARRLAAQPGAHVLAAANTKDSLSALSDEVKDLLAVECNVLKRDSVRRGLRLSVAALAALCIRQVFDCLCAVRCSPIARFVEQPYSQVGACALMCCI